MKYKDTIHYSAKAVRKSKIRQGPVWTLVLVLIFTMLNLPPASLSASQEETPQAIDENTALLSSDSEQAYTLLDVDGFRENQIELHSLYALVRGFSPYGKIDYLDMKSDEHLALGSLTQLMTYKVARKLMEQKGWTMDTKLEITEEDIRWVQEHDLSYTGFNPGDKPTIEELLIAMVIKAGGDAISCLVRNLAAEEQTFVKTMNLEAEALGLRDTAFLDSVGKDEEAYSSLNDMAILVESLLQDAYLTEMMAYKTYRTGPLASYPDGLEIESIVSSYGAKSQIDISSIASSKTGHTQKSGFSLLTLEKVGKSYFLILTSRAKTSGQEIEDHIYLKHNMENLPYHYPLLSTEKDLGPVTNGEQSYYLYPKTKYEAFLPLWTDLGAFTYKLELDENAALSPTEESPVGRIRIFREDSAQYKIEEVEALELYTKLEAEESRETTSAEPGRSSETSPTDSEPAKLSTGASPSDSVTPQNPPPSEDKQGPSPWIFLIVAALLVVAVFFIRHRIKLNRQKARDKAKRLDDLHNRYKH